MYTEVLIFTLLVLFVHEVYLIPISDSSSSINSIPTPIKSNPPVNSNKTSIKGASSPKIISSLKETTLSTTSNETTVESTTSYSNSTSITSTTEQPKPEGYVELPPPIIRILVPGKEPRVLQKEELLNLKKLLKPNSTELILFELVRADGWSEILTDHQLHRLCHHDVIASIVSKHVSALTSRGFSHSFLLIEKDGGLKFFYFNLTLPEAIVKLPVNYPKNFVMSKFPYHSSFIESLSENFKD